MSTDGFHVIARYPKGVIDISATFPELSPARALTLQWLLPQYSEHLGETEPALLAAMNLLSDNYVGMLDSRQGIQTLADMIAHLLGHQETAPFCLSEQ